MGGAHILVVDDDGYFRSSVADALTGQGHRIPAPRTFRPRSPCCEPNPWTSWLPATSCPG